MQLPNSMSIIQRGDVDVLCIDNEHASAQIALFGAHILSYIPKSDNRERLWLSDNAIFDNKTPIRGGVPVCWPWFSDAHNQQRDDLPSHGFVRTQVWHLVEFQESEKGLRLHFSPQSCQGPGWPHLTQCVLTVDVGKSLRISLHTTNLDTASLPLNCALHTYFKVNDIATTQLLGVSGVYRDKTQNWQELVTPTPYQFTQETDRIHLSAIPQVTLVDEFETQITSSGHDSIVVWNPWIENSQKMQDMSDNGYRTMLCVETAVTQTKHLGAGEQMMITQEIK
ncbi:D-hexose-6-phosphate mutarotase [Aliiglaciecola litoralis]|uniref:Putative glucose-6-phosphate 1-epimerase n=1 Tax=Aliiglaciecola litoralis TaxID=582857 RepID=A0ABN1LL72_9ALTE